jgi:Kef-type K+ transport system membrane component KefB
MTSANLVLTLLLQVVAILTACRLLGMLGRRLGQTQAVSDMIAGILLGPSLFGALLPSLQAWLFPQHITIEGSATMLTHPSMSILYALSQLGLVLYMFIVGLEFNTDLFRGRVRNVSAVSSAGIAVPFVLGAAASMLMVSRPGFFPPGIGNWHASLFLGASLSVTAFPVLARILDEKNVASTRLGTLTLAAGAMDDVVAWCLLATLLASLKAMPSLAILAVAGGVVYTIVMLRFAKTALRGLARRAERDRGVLPATLLMALVVLMLSASFTEAIGIHAVFGAFVAGVVMPRGLLADGLREQMQTLTTTLLLPLFFVYSGLNTRIALLNAPALWMWTAVIVLIAVAGKGLACAIAARVAGESWRDAATIGTLMNARGLVELIMLNVGLQAGIIHPTLFTMLVLMAVITTVMASPLFELFYGRQLAGREPAGTATATAGLP